MKTWAEFDRNDPDYTTLVAIMTDADLGTAHILSAIFAIAEQRDPGGAAVEYIANGGVEFAIIARLLDWSPAQLLRATTALVASVYMRPQDGEAVH